MRRLLLGACSLAALGLAISSAPGCGSDDGDSTFDAGSSGSSGTSGGGCVGLACPPEGGKPGCVGLECQQQPCDTGATTLTGTVFDPAGKVPIYNATVYVPLTKDEPLADLPEGTTSGVCDRCDAKVSGKPIAITTTDTSGNFKIDNAPFGENIPLVVQIGKWRRKVLVPNVPKCMGTKVDAALTHLPKNRNEGHIPRFALTTGAADPLQCLLRKIGLDDAEFGVAGSDSRVHLYAGGGTASPPTVASSKFAATLNNGAAFGSAETFWASLPNLQKYDIVLLSCEGAENEDTAGATKPDPAKQALYDYAKGGGRVFASHYHEVWLRKSPEAGVKGVATWSDPERPPPASGNPATTAVNADISSAFPKAVAMKDWLSKQNALVSEKLPIFDARHNVDAVSASGLNWISLPNPNSTPTPNVPAVQYMTFNTPVGAADAAVCGRVVFSNLHVGAGTGDDPQADFPNGCSTQPLSAQQKALEFMLFDLSSCIQKDDAPIEQPH